MRTRATLLFRSRESRLVVSKRTGTGKLCFRSNIGEQSRRLEVVANSLAGDVWAAGDEIEVRVSSSVPVRKPPPHTPCYS